MSGSSRHGPARPPGAAASKPGTGRPAAGRPESGQPRSDKPGSGKPGSGRPGSGRRDSGYSGSSGRPPAARPLPPIDADRVTKVIEPVIHALDLDLEGVRITAAGRRRLLRLVVDGDSGVSLDAMARASRELSAVLDDSDVMGDLPYVLEVSSPGVDRPLTERRHWRRAIGRLVAVPLAAGPESSAPASGATEADAAGAAVVEGRVTGASADGVTLDVNGESREFGYGDLGPGRIKVEFARLADADEDDVDDDAEADDLSADDELSADELSADEEGRNGY